MEKLIVANHKMNLTYKEMTNYLNEIKDLDIIFFPSSIYIPYFSGNKIKAGIQNIYVGDFGSYTGEISAYQAKSIGVSFALIGHAERRILFKEDDELINKKVKSALHNNLNVILCVGEDKTDDYKSVIENQIKKDLEGIDKEVIISYEPIWAIGNGITPPIEKIEEVITFIKSLFDYDVKVIYGGSVGTYNIDTLNKIPNVSGFIVGAESLDTKKLKKIREVTS